MELTREALEAAIREHVDAEATRDLETLRSTLDDDVAYEIKTVGNPNLGEVYGTFMGADTYIAMWERLYTIFASYEIEIEDVLGLPELQAGLVRIQATATPFEEWRGLPAGEPVRWWAAALCFFDEGGRMTRETVYGSFPPIMDGYDKLLEQSQSA